MSLRWLLGSLSVTLGLFAACTAPPRTDGMPNPAACDGCEPTNNSPGAPRDGVNQDMYERERPNGLCRDTPGCDLDSEEGNCTFVADPAGGGGAGGAAGAGPGAGGEAGQGGDAGASRVEAAGAGGAGEQKYACRMVRSALDGVLKCDLAGDGDHQTACSSSISCKPGFSCVRVPNPLFPEGQPMCLHSCCSAGACGQVKDKTYCTALPLVEGATTGSSGLPSLLIPVCAPVKPCDVLKPTGGVCADDEVCRIVDDRGTASCEKSSGLILSYSGEPCGTLRSCAPGYVCLQDSNTCRKLCPLGDDASCGSDGTCLNGGLVFPAGVGICGPDSSPPP